MSKTVLDLLVSMLGLIFLAPFFIIIGILIKIDSPGDIFYKQERVGQNGKLFKLLKFRTMDIGADKATSITVGERDPRITKIGFYLRKYKLDELPQLINVLVRDMSLVGPRPELKKFVDLYEGVQRQVITVRPGITDFASIKFRNENELLAGKEDPIQFYIKEIMPLKLKMNLDYINDQSFWLDVKIIFKTVFSVLKK